MKSKLFVALSFVAAMTLTGCVMPIQQGGAYSRQDVSNTMAVQLGKVEAVRQVNLDGSSSGLGTVGGAAIGGVAGSTMGGGKGKSLMTIIGALAGAVAGSAVEKGVTSAQGVEILVRTETGSLIAVVQEQSAEQFVVGQRVRVLTRGARSVVTAHQ